MLQDLRFTLRLIMKDSGYTLVAVLTLALGIAVNATGFMVVNAVFLRGPGFPMSDELRMLSWQSREGRRLGLSYADLQDLRTQSRTFSDIAGFSDLTMNISDDSTMPEQVEGSQLTANAFSVLRQQPLIGRNFAAQDGQRGAESVAIIGFRLWQNRYGGDPGVLGRSIRVNGQPATIIGIMPDRMNFPINADIWIPFIPTTSQEQRNARPLQAIGRLQQGQTTDSARAELSGMAQRFAAEYADTSAELAGARVETITERFVGGTARVVFPLVMGAGAFVLLIAMANVANLLLSRSADRAREVGMRIALGASRWRVLRQLLLESIVLGCIGGAAGFLLAWAGARMIDASVSDPGKPYWIVFTMDYVVTAYVAAISILTGILFGLAPALHVSKASFGDVLKQSGRGAAGGRTRWFSGTLVVAELALTIVLLVGAGLMIRSFFNHYTTDLGFRSQNLTAMRLQLPATKYSTPNDRLRFFDQLESRVSTIPGVQAVTLTTSVPPLGGGGFPAFEIEGRPPAASDDEAPAAVTPTVSPSFFDVLGLQAARGRLLNETDGAPGFENIVINERMASMFFPGEDPLGKRIRLSSNEPWLTIVGVSPSIHHGSLSMDAPLPAIYRPLRLSPADRLSLMVRSTLPPASIMDAVRREVRLLDEDQPVFTIATVDQLMAEDRFGVRLIGGIFGVFAAIALALAAVGLFAVMAYGVSQRTQEIGIRMALGAQRREVLWLVLRRGLAHLAIGLAFGLAGAVLMAGALERALINITPTDPLTFSGITLLIVVVAITACIIPASRAARIDPLAAIRTE